MHHEMEVLFHLIDPNEIKKSLKVTWTKRQILVFTCAGMYAPGMEKSGNSVK